MTEAENLTVEQIKASLPKLSDEEINEISAALVKDAGRRLIAESKE